MVKKASPNSLRLGLTIAAVVVLGLIGVIITVRGKFNSIIAHEDGLKTATEFMANSNPYQTKLRNNLELQQMIRQAMFDEIDQSATRIRDNLRFVTKEYHIAGSVEQTRLMGQLADIYKSFGMLVFTPEYQACQMVTGFDNST